MIYKIIQPVLSALMIFFCSTAMGQQDSEPEKISVDEAVAMAIRSNREYRIALQQVEQAREDANRAWSSLVPELSSQASVTRQNAESGVTSLSDGQYDLRFVQLQFALNPGSFYHSLKASYRACGAAKEELRRVRNDLEYNVIKSYFDVILSQEMVILRKNSIEVLTENLKDVDRLFQSGSVPRFELLQAQVKLKSTEPELLEAENDLRLALDMFNFHLGSDRTAYTVQDYGIVLSGVREPVRHDISDKLISTAMKNRPEVLQLMLRREGIEQARDVHRSAYLWPTFSVSGSYGMTYMLPNDVTIDMGNPAISPDLSGITGKREWQHTWQVNVAATYRWGTLMPVHGERAMERKERLRIKETEERIEQIKRSTAIMVRSSYGNLVSAYETILSRKKNIETAEEGLRIARESYKNGIIKNSELLGSELALTEARTGFIRALYDYYVNRAGLTRQIGTDKSDLIFGEERK